MVGVASPGPVRHFSLEGGGGGGGAGFDLVRETQTQKRTSALSTASMLCGPVVARSVVVLGLDGAGKTSLLELVKDVPSASARVRGSSGCQRCASQKPCPAVEHPPPPSRDRGVRLRAVHTDLPKARLCARGGEGVRLLLPPKPAASMRGTLLQLQLVTVVVSSLGSPFSAARPCSHTCACLRWSCCAKV
jgi:hypothetical protein